MENGNGFQGTGQFFPTGWPFGPIWKLEPRIIIKNFCFFLSSNKPPELEKEPWVFPLMEPRNNQPANQEKWFQITN